MRTLLVTGGAGFIRGPITGVGQPPDRLSPGYRSNEALWRADRAAAGAACGLQGQ